MTMNNSRIQKLRIPVEIQQLQKSQPQHGIICTTLPATPDDFSCLEAAIPGPEGSPYEDGLFKLIINFGEQYPFRPPSLKFITPIYHPNIDNAGKICLDILRMPPNGTYNPAITLESILLSIQLLLANPNPDDPLQEDAAVLYKSNKELFYQKAKNLVKRHCQNEDKEPMESCDVKERVRSSIDIKTKNLNLKLKLESR